MDFEALTKEAQRAIDINNGGIATAVLTNKGNIYVTVCKTFPNCCGKPRYDSSLIDMIENGEKKITKMVSMHKHGMEPPCAWLRQFIREMDHSNINAEVMAMGRNAPAIKLLGDFSPNLSDYLGQFNI